MKVAQQAFDAVACRLKGLKISSGTDACGCCKRVGRAVARPLPCERKPSGQRGIRLVRDGLGKRLCGSRPIRRGPGQTGTQLGRSGIGGRQLGECCPGGSDRCLRRRLDLGPARTFGERLKQPQRLPCGALRLIGLCNLEQQFRIRTIHRPKDPLGPPGKAHGCIGTRQRPTEARIPQCTSVAFRRQLVCDRKRIARLGALRERQSGNRVCPVCGIDEPGFNAESQKLNRRLTAKGCVSQRCFRPQRAHAQIIAAPLTSDSSKIQPQQMRVGGGGKAPVHQKPGYRDHCLRARLPAVGPKIAVQRQRHLCVARGLSDPSIQKAAFWRCRRTHSIAAPRDGAHCARVTPTAGDRSEIAERRRKPGAQWLGHLLDRRATSARSRNRLVHIARCGLNQRAPRLGPRTAILGRQGVALGQWSTIDRQGERCQQSLSARRDIVVLGDAVGFSAKTMVKVVTRKRLSRINVRTVELTDQPNPKRRLPLDEVRTGRLESQIRLLRTLRSTGWNGQMPRGSRGSPDLLLGSCHDGGLTVLSWLGLRRRGGRFPLLRCDSWHIISLFVGYRPFGEIDNPGLGRPLELFEQPRTGLSHGIYGEHCLVHLPRISDLRRQDCSRITRICRDGPRGWRRRCDWVR